MKKTTTTTNEHDIHDIHLCGYDTGVLNEWRYIVVPVRWAIYKHAMVIPSQAFSGIPYNFRVFNNDLDSRPFTNGTFG